MNNDIWQKTNIYDNKGRLFGVYDVDINSGSQTMNAQYSYKNEGELEFTVDDIKKITVRFS